jgi:hypothetical protein
MARFLSPEWFAEVAGAAPASEPTADALTIEQVVEATPDGPVRYRVIVAGGTARLVGPGHGVDGSDPDLTITSDWSTAVAIARGQLATQAALMTGRLRIRGNLARLAGRAEELAGLDPVPADVRRHTTY